MLCIWKVEINSRKDTPNGVYTLIFQNLKKAGKSFLTILVKEDTFY